MVRIAGFHPADPGSIPGVGKLAHLAQLVERKTFNLVVVGSSPTAGIDPKGRKSISLYSYFRVVYPSLVNGARLKIECFTLRGIEARRYYPV